MKKYIFLALIICIPFQAMWQTSITASETESMVSEMKKILDQYAAKIKYLELENSILREEIRKAWIQIPLSAFSGAINTTPASSSDLATQNQSGGTLSLSGSQSNNNKILSDAMIDTIKKNYGERYSGFVTRIHAEWEWIRWAYKFPVTSYIGWYEFVKQGADNHAFVNIVYDRTTATNAYDAKILYEYNTGTFQRKLIGLFELDRSTGFYKTKSGTNPFAWVSRVFIKDPKSETAIIPTTSMTWSSTSTPEVNNAKIPTFAEIEKAYADKRYLSVISLSNTYLTANPPTYDLLRIRYKTYFIIGKYTESLSEISKIESIWTITKTVACDAQVIATYSKDAAMITKYTNACKK